MFVERTEKILENIQPTRQIAPVALAFLGDTVFDLFLRTRIVMEEKTSPKNMHLHAAQYAKAQTQARMAKAIWDLLSEEEQDTLRRGRTAKVNTVPKHAEVADYKMATGFEAMLGELYLQKKEDRLWEILNLGMDAIRDQMGREVENERNR